jgi:penicillin amidase
MSQRETTLSGTSGPVRIERNEQGVAQISAEDLDDTWLGLGFCHARDRGLQILFVRILGRGEASQRLGATDELLALDRFFRRMNFHRDGPGEFDALSPRARKGVEAYCRGINLAFEHGHYPWELRLLGNRVGDDPWTLADVSLTGKMIGYVSLATSQADMERWIVECVQNGISREALEELFPGQLGGLDLDLIRKIRLGERIIPEGLWRVSGLPAATGSNNWVVAGSKTASGHPYLANDPHLQINRLPAIWYEAVLRWGQGRYVMGATMPGAPGFPIGRNPDLAWGVTYAFMDCVDSWVEDCRDGQYRRGDAWQPFQVREEVIHRRRKPSVVLRFFDNEHGTLDGDPAEPGYYLATRWSCGEGTANDSLDGLFGIVEARSVEEGRAWLGRVGNSSWSWVLADRAGAIGFQMSGKMPLRREGVSGLVPLPGWDTANDWQGFAPADDLPRAFNPPEGLLATANHDLNPLGRRRPINVCVAPYRFERITEVLSRPGPFTIDDMKALQFDLHSPQAERFLELLRPLLDDPMLLPDNARTLKEWDGVYRDDSRGAFFFERFYRALLETVFGGLHGRLGSKVVAHLLDETALLSDMYEVFDRVLLAENSVWFGGRRRHEIYRMALSKGLGVLSRPYGASRRFVLRHLLFGGKLPRVFRFDRGPITLQGSRATVHQGQIIRQQGRTIVQGPSYRLVTDLAVEAIETTLPGGPSDRPFSRWYASGLADWQKGTYKTLIGPEQKTTHSRSKEHRNNNLTSEREGRAT